VFVCQSVHPSHHSATDAAGVMLWAWRAKNIDQLLNGWCSAANASNVTLPADLGS